MARKKRSYRSACAQDIANGNSSKFTRACKRRFPDLAGGEAVSEGPTVSPRRVKAAADACRQVLSEEMKKGHRKTAFRAYWACRRKHEQQG